MRRGSTPTNTFNCNVDLAGATLFVTYSQGGANLVEKTGDDLTIVSTQSGCTVTVRLSQAETLKFKTGQVMIQIRYVMPDGSADASNIIQTTAERILKDGVIEYAV